MDRMREMLQAQETIVVQKGFCTTESGVMLSDVCRADVCQADLTDTQRCCFCSTQDTESYDVLHSLLN